jgi:hypothetical protein
VRTSTGPRLAAAVVLALVLAVASACGGGIGDGGDEGGKKSEAATPSCLDGLTPASIPKDGSFPTDWPFPPGTVVTGTEEVPGGGLAITAQVGSDFEEVLPFMQHDLEDAGFVATNGEAEKDDAEATWTGGGYAGTWAIKSSDTCKGSTLLQVAAARQ